MGWRMRSVLIGSAVLVLTLALVASALPWLRHGREVERDAEIVRQAIALGRFDRARDPLDRWLRARPGSAEAHAMLGQVALADGDLAEVTRCMNQARTLGWPREKLERLHAITLARIGRHAEAEAILTRARRPRSEPDPMIDEALARVYLKTYRLGEARDVIRRWMEQAPGDARPYLWLTEIDRRIEVDNPDSWERHYRAALLRDPGLDAARLGLAETLAHMHRNIPADEQYRLYLERHPNDPAALAGAGRNAVELGDVSRGSRLLEQALGLDPRNAVALKGMADVDLHRGDLKSSRERLDRVIRADPFDQEALNRRAGIRTRLGDAEGSRADRAALDRLKRDQAELLGLRSRVLAEPSNNDLRARVAAWMFAHGRDQEGVGWATAILASDPAHVPTCRLLADYYARRPDQAGLANYYRIQAERGSTGVRP